MKFARLAIAYVALFWSCAHFASAQEPLPDRGPAYDCKADDKDYDESNLARCTARLGLAALTTTERAMTFNIRANTYDAMKKHELAIADYSEVIRLLPKWPYGYANRALEYCRLQRCKEALRDYDKALELSPANSWSLYGRGVARIRSGDRVGGEADLAAAARIDPDIAATYREIHMEP